MRILMLTQWFEPEPVSFKGLYFAHELVRRGHQVEILTGFPNYPEGKLYPGYRLRPWQREMLEGIPVHRVPLYPSHDRSAMHRAANYMSFAISAALLGPFLTSKPDIVYVLNLVPLGPAASVQRMLRGARVIYDVQDLWPESVATSDMLQSRPLLRMLERWCNYVYRRADHVVSLSPGIRDELIRRGLPPDRVTTIYNWCDERAIQPHKRDGALAERLGLADTFNVIFAGNMGLAQALEFVLQAAAQLSKSYPQIRFVFVGGGVERDRLESLVQNRGLANVTFLPRQPLEAMGPILALADVLLVHLKDDPLFRITIPSKTQAYLASGIPVLMAVCGDAADLIRRSGGGLTCMPQDPASIADGVLRFFRMPEIERLAMGQAGRAYYQRELSLRVGVSRFEGCFCQALNQKGNHHP